MQKKREIIYAIEQNALIYGDDNAKIYSRYSAEEMNQWAAQRDNMFNKDVTIFFIRAARNFAELMALQ